jgi:hypothetical protein
MSEHPLDDLIRDIDPDKFSEAAHGAGHRIVLAGDKSRFYGPSLLGRLFGRRDGRHFFVKTWSVPKEVKDWRFHWSEGTSAISLDFDASFVIQANENVQALKLVEGLRGGGPVGEVLYGLINARLHQELARLLLECNSKTASLLDSFRISSIGIGESSELNRRVSDGVSQALGGALFRIGFALKNAPPMQIEVRQTDSFTLADSKQVRKAQTTALLHLDNYQSYKKSALESESAVRDTIGQAITRAVKQLLFAGKYYDVVRSFAQQADSIEARMRALIRTEAATIGYRVEMFQTYPDIAALKLLDPLRIDILAGDDKYYLVNASGYVQVGVALSVQVGQSFSRLHLLIDPDAPDVAGPIVEQVKRICRDTIQRFDRMQFNLQFDDQVVPAINQAIVKGLGAYGLETEVVHVVQAPTEDATRFMAIRGRTMGFDLVIEPHANDGNADSVRVAGKVEVTGMAELGWERFEAKDFGYRQDTHLTEARLRQHAHAQALNVSAVQPMPRDERRLLAIDLELIEIRDRVVNALQEVFSKVVDLAMHWRSLKGSQSIIKEAQRIAERTVADEFGLSVALRGMRRNNTEGEQVNQVRRSAGYDLLRQQAQQDIEQEMSARRLLDADQLALLKDAGRKDRDALDDEMHPRHDEVRQRAGGAQGRSDGAPRLTTQDALNLLPKRRASATKPGQLPWDAGPASAKKTLPAPGPKDSG